MTDEGVRAEALAIMDRFETEPNHVRHVARLTLHLFDQMDSWRHLSPRDRLLLETAAVLHDIGWKVAPDGKNHHKESARLIREEPWRNLEPDEVNLVALIARYHRKAVPSAEHSDFAALNEASQLKVRQLAALLRIGDALDRRHMQFVRSVVLTHRDGQLWFSLDAGRIVNPEIEAAIRKGDLLCSLLNCELRFEYKNIMLP